VVHGRARAGRGTRAARAGSGSACYGSTARARTGSAARARIGDTALARIGDTALARIGDTALARIGDTALARIGDTALARIGGARTHRGAGIRARGDGFRASLRHRAGARLDAHHQRRAGNAGHRTRTGAPGGGKHGHYRHTGPAKHRSDADHFLPRPVRATPAR
jgi:hypothetical protein